MSRNGGLKGRPSTFSPKIYELTIRQNLRLSLVGAAIEDVTELHNDGPGRVLGLGVAGAVRNKLLPVLDQSLGRRDDILVVARLPAKQNYST